MAASREVFAWPEAKMYLNGDQLLFVEDLSLTVTWQWKRDKSLASGTNVARTTFTLEDKEVQINCGQLYYGSGFYEAANSAVAHNFSVTAINEADGVTASFGIQSAVITQFQLQGSEAGLFKATVSMIAADVTGL